MRSGNLVANLTAKQKADLQESRERVARGEQWHVTIRKLAKYGMFAWLGHYVVEIAEALAGRVTIADISVGLSLLAKEHTSQVGLAISTIVSTTWAILERRLRRRSIKRLGRKAANAEIQEDPDRSTSSLTESGDTNPRDR